METNRRSLSVSTSSRVSAMGSNKTPSASEKRTPCFRRLAFAFLGSQATFMYASYAYQAPTSRSCRRLGCEPRASLNVVDQVRCVRVAFDDDLIVLTGIPSATSAKDSRPISPLAPLTEYWRQRSKRFIDRDDVVPLRVARGGRPSDALRKVVLGGCRVRLALFFMRLALPSCGGSRRDDSRPGRSIRVCHQQKPTLARLTGSSLDMH